MSSSTCAKCEKTVYPVEGLRCLDKIWHKGCFKCHECNMTLNMKNYKGFEKRPYCNAHCPQAKATTVADTPEIRRLAKNTLIQSQAKYHEDFEKSRGKGFTAIADDPETLRIKNTSKIISNAAYHGEIERKKSMEEKRSRNVTDDSHALDSDNNNNKQNRMHRTNLPAQDLEPDFAPNQINIYQHQDQFVKPQQQHLQQLHHQQQLHQQQQLQLQKQQQQQQQQLLIKQQQHQQQQQHMYYAQEHHGQPARQLKQVESPLQQQPAKYPITHPLQQQQQYLIRPQQQQQRMISPQHRQSIDSNMPLNRQLSKQSNVSSNPPHQMMKQQMVPSQHHKQQPTKFMPLNESVGYQAQPSHLMGGSHVISHPSQLGIPNGGQKIAPNPAMMAGAQNMMPAGYNQYQMGTNGPMPKQQQHLFSSPQRHMMHSSQIQAIDSHHQMRPLTQQMLQMQLQQQTPSRRVFRAMYDYVANDVDEVSFFENDILIDCVNVDGNWLIGKVARSGQTGMLPANYVAEFSGH